MDSGVDYAGQTKCHHRPEQFNHLAPKQTTSTSQWQVCITFGTISNAESLENLINFNAAMVTKARSVMAYDEALAFYTAKKFKDSLPLMIEASELGNAQAMSILGTMYLMGQGVQENGQQAVTWLQRSIDAGFEGAISVLGMAYATGKGGIRIDLVKAR